MTSEDSKLIADIFEDDEPFDSGSYTAMPTSDGYDYLTLMLSFQDVVDKGFIPIPGPFFLAPPASCTFSVH